MKVKGLSSVFFSCVLFAGFTVSVHAASSQLYFDNVSGLGNAYAGEAVIVEDASVEYFNPAGLTSIDHPQLVAGDIEGRFNGKFTGTDTFAIPPFISITQTGTAKGKPVIAPYPLLYYSRPLTNCLTMGLGMLTPYGIGVSIPQDSIAKYSGTRFVMYVIDLSAALAYKYNEQFSVGLGLDLQQLNFLARSMFPSPTRGPDSKIINQAGGGWYGWGLGWHMGLLYKIRPTTHVGFAFHSQTVFHPRGQSQFVYVPGSDVGNEIVSNNFNFTRTLPPTWTVSALQIINPCWTIMGTVDFAQWAMVNKIVLKHIAIPSPTGQPSTGNGVVAQYYRNTWRFALGTNIAINPQWLLRFGVSYETDPTNKNYRLLTDPGTAATSVTIGARYQVTCNVGLDAGYLHAFVKPSTINYSNGLHTNVGRDRLQRDAVGVQVVWDIV